MSDKMYEVEYWSKPVNGDEPVLLRKVYCIAPVDTRAVSFAMDNLRDGEVPKLFLVRAKFGD